MFLQVISTVVDGRLRSPTNAKPNKTQKSPKNPRIAKQEAARPSKVKQKPAKATICHQMPTTDFPHCSGLYRSSTILYQPAINHEPTLKSTDRQHTVFRIVAGFIGCHCSVPNTRINKPVTPQNGTVRAQKTANNQQALFRVVTVFTSFRCFESGKPTTNKRHGDGTPHTAPDRRFYEEQR